MQRIVMFQLSITIKELRRKFNKVFVYSMNDEVVHTEYLKMAHYEIYLCVK